ncbi:omega-hydroxyceramide transacylase-like isoform X2 [Vidua chalybeata]|uniref:omega-hydroxyceramide transacylase-like isoform X2 n=1 Tax=Vidua chalybeata TaxID=81927 RepID=UPI0023A8395C|nr:omega-hydroxyceramide transacylase-like isoform X2 [Vidua chalybeata]
MGMCSLGQCQPCLLRRQPLACEETWSSQEATEGPRIYGGSSGSILATVGLCGCDLDELKEYVLSRLKISLWGLVPGRGVPRLLRETLDKFLPPNAHELVSGKLHIILTRLHDWRCVTVSEFASKEELIQVGAATGNL